MSYPAGVTPSNPGRYLCTPDMPNATPEAVDVVIYKNVLMARLPDDDAIEVHPFEDLSGSGAVVANEK